MIGDARVAPAFIGHHVYHCIAWVQQQDLVLGVTQRHGACRTSGPRRVSDHVWWDIRVHQLKIGAARVAQVYEPGVLLGNDDEIVAGDRIAIGEPAHTLPSPVSSTVSASPTFQPFRLILEPVVL